MKTDNSTIRDKADQWWQTKRDVERVNLIQKYSHVGKFSLREMVEQMYLSEHPTETIKEVDNLSNGGGFMLLLNEGEEDESKISLAGYINMFDEDFECDFIKVVNLIVGQSCQYGADHIKRIS